MWRQVLHFQHALDQIASRMPWSPCDGKSIFTRVGLPQIVINHGSPGFYGADMKRPA
jgi:hypothetical protein